MARVGGKQKSSPSYCYSSEGQDVLLLLIDGIVQEREVKGV